MKTSKPRIKAKEKRLIALIFLCFFILFVAASLLAYYTPTSPDQSQYLYSQPAAAIVDHLSLTFPNRTFVETATSMLEQAGYIVDYYPGENVTVDLYKSLPTYGYKIIILRVHCGIAEDRQEIAFFTSEVYSQSKYTLDLLYDRLGTATYHNPPDPGETPYFAIRSLFVKDAMKGRFNQTTIIMTGCYGLKYPSMAEAFIEKGAKIYIGWDGLESADHSDEATLALLRHLILEKQAIGQAVENTVKEVGEDPTYKSLLGFYPSASGEQTIGANENRPKIIIPSGRARFAFEIVAGSHLTV